MDVVVVNPCMLVGPRLDGRPLSPMFTLIAEQKTGWVPPGGTSVADVLDVAEGCVLAFERGRKGERYILGGTNVSWSEFYSKIARAFGVPAPSRRVPIAAARALELGARVLDCARLSRPPWTPEILRTWGLYGFVDASKARRELGYAFRPVEEVVERAARSLLRA
jgi:nucleoside-diphosphate-sugar epimerase